MTSGFIKTTKFLQSVLNSEFLGTTSVPTKGIAGMGTDSPNSGDTALTLPFPWDNGTVVDDGDNALTGSNGGNNSTDNTSTYKIGANQTDNTAQNLLTNTTSATKTWTLTLTTTIDKTKPFGLWLYIKDSATLAKFASSGTALEIKFGSDSSNYYSKTYTASDLSTGWNWLTSGNSNVEDLTETGTVGSPIDTFIIEITTNNATDSFSSGDVVYDLLRQWSDSDYQKDFTTNYPAVDTSALKAEERWRWGTTNGNGALVSEIGTVDASGNLKGRAVFSPASKGTSDIFIFSLITKARNKE